MTTIETENRALAKLLVQRSYVEGDFVLASGRRSNVYFDCRLTTCFPEAMPMIGRAFLAEFRSRGVRPRSVGGLTSGADPVAQSIAYHALGEGAPISMFSVRKDRKEHGTGKWIEGCAESPVAVVDDVITSGGSVIRAIEHCQEENLQVSQVVVLVDREEGGLNAIQSVVPGVSVSAIFTRSGLDALRAQERGS